jgi:hypothetical protein
MKNIFGLAEDLVFESSPTVLPSISDIDLNVTSTYLIVMCSAVEPQYINGHMGIFFKMVPSSQEYGKLVHVESNPILYLPVSTAQDIDNLLIQLCDENGVLVPTKPQSNTLAMLHFRSRIL